MQPKAAETIGLAIHELATNAIKHGALAAKEGRVNVSWKLVGTDGQSKIVLEWIETGLAMPELSPKRRGFGTELLSRSLAYELSGNTELQFKPTGLSAPSCCPRTTASWLLGTVRR